METPKIYGKVREHVSTRISEMRSRTSAMIIEIGQLEVRKAALLTEIQALEADASAILAAEATRMGIPEGRPWQILPNGVAVERE